MRCDVAPWQPSLDPRVVDDGSKQVVLLDCLDDTKWQLYERDGSPAKDGQGVREKVDATVVFRDGAWVVTRLKLHEPATC